MGFIKPIVFEIILVSSIGVGAEIKKPSKCVACQNSIGRVENKSAFFIGYV